MGAKKENENLGQARWSSGSDLNPGPPDYKAGLPPTGPQHSVM